MGCFFLNYDDSTIYNMCTQKPPNDYSQQLYDKYKEAFQEHINSTVRILVDYFFLTSLCMLNISLFMLLRLMHIVAACWHAM